MPSPIVKIAAAAVLYAGVVTLTLLPQGAVSWGSVGLLALALVALGIPVVGWVRNMVRIERADQARQRANIAAFWRTLAEISWLEELHVLPSAEPNRTSHTRPSEGS